MSSRDALARALFAEAIRDLHPWRLCASAGGPEVGTEELVEELEQGLGADPDHIGLLHFYIVHAIRGFWHFSRGMAFVGKRHLGQAQDEMPCSEPPPWFYPARESLGALLRRHGSATERKGPPAGWRKFCLRTTICAPVVNNLR